MYIRYMRLALRSVLAVAVGAVTLQVGAVTLQVGAQTKTPLYALTPWSYGMIAWAGGAPADAQTASAEIEQAAVDVFAFWDLQLPAPIEAGAVVQTSSYWMPPLPWDELPTAPEEAWFPNSDADTPSWWVVPPLPWQGGRIRPLLVVVFPDLETLGDAVGLFGPVGFFFGDDYSRSGVMKEAGLRPAAWLAHLVAGHPAILVARSPIGAVASWWQYLHHELAHWAFFLASYARTSAQSDGLDESAAISEDDAESILSDAKVEEQLARITEDLQAVALCVYFLDEGFAEFTDRALAGDASWLAIHAKLFRDVDLLPAATGQAPMGAAASVVRQLATRVGNAHVIDEIIRVALGWREELPVLESEWRLGLPSEDLSEGALVYSQAAQQELGLVERMLAPLLSEEAQAILARICSRAGRMGDVEAFWTEVALPATAADAETWQRLRHREESFRYYATDPAATALADRVELKLVLARTIEDWHEYRSWFIYAVRALVAGLVPSSSESSAPWAGQERADAPTP
ncbi:MAG: hypothetical protein PHU43_03980 [Candidatus Bipolaricaulis sp.]|nr:hypothetical protein [Candidatus Bipolaricaulis sp.]